MRVDTILIHFKTVVSHALRPFLIVSNVTLTLQSQKFDALYAQISSSSTIDFCAKSVKFTFITKDSVTTFQDVPVWQSSTKP